MLRSTVGVCFGIVAGCVARSAYAGAETVQLTNGSTYEGELVEKVPGDHLTIKLATGEVRRFEWNDIVPAASSQTPARPITQIAVAQPTPPQQVAFSTLPPRPAHVRFNADVMGAILMRVDSVVVNNVVQTFATERETPVCYAPCDASVDANARYYVEGAYIARSARFAIPEGDSTLTARTGSSGVAAAGGWLLGVGILSLITGAIATPIAFATSTGPDWNGWEYFGVTSLIAGAGLILLSLPFVVAARTHVGIGAMDVAHHEVRWQPNGFRF